MTPPWLQPLTDALDLEYPTQPRIATLATVDPAHRPHARSVVLRRIDDQGTLTIVSDARSKKNAHLRANPLAELVLYLPTRREQFRLAGPVRLVTAADHDPARQQAWESLRDESRAHFTWPAPGHPRPACDATNLLQLPATHPIPESFELLLLTPDHVDHLDLKPATHLRTRWRAADAWQPENINP